MHITVLGAIQALQSGGGVTFPEKIVTKVFGSTLLAFRRGGYVSNLHKKTSGT